MKKFKKTIGMLLAIIMVSVTMLPTTVAHAAGTMAFSVGTDYGGLFGVDTTSDATNARDLYAIAGYNSYSSTQPTVSILKGSFSTGTKRMQSDILFFSGHGNYNSVSVPNIIGVVDEDSAIEAARMNIPDFCSDDYEVKIYEICKGCYTIDFVFTVDGIRTNSGYTMTVVDGVIATIVDNTIDFNADEVKTAVAQFSIGSDVAVMSAAKEETNSSQLKDATDQEVVYFYDIESGTFQKIVFTVYQFDGTDAVGKDMYIQNMN